MDETAKMNGSREDLIKLQDPPAVLKKKKERGNRNFVLRNDLIYDWIQKEAMVTVTIQVGPGHDQNSVEVIPEKRELSVALHDGRKFQVKLFDQIFPQMTSVTFKSHSCIVKLFKCNTTKEWKSLEAPASNFYSRPAGTKPKPRLQTALPLNIDKQDAELPEVCQASETEPFEDDENLIEVVNPKTNFCEHTGERNMAVFLYIKNINRESLIVHFCFDKVILRFSTSDPNFLQNYTDATKDSRFKWTLPLKGTIVPDQCSYKLGQANLEIKLKKKDTQTWSTLSPTMSTNSEVTKDIWVPVGATADASSGKHANIPPAPPASPPFHETRKPTSLASSLNKGSISSLGSGSAFHLPTIGLDTNSSGSICNRGMTGLDNIGNTCFMNSVLQCLLNTRELRNYFEGHFQQDINKDNPLGMGGKLALCFAALMDLVWKGSVRSHAPTKLKNIMSLKANQFSGYAQHDAQEFMVELLDGLHEDLNRIKKKPYIAEPPELDGFPDHEAADISWKLHKSRNDSIVDDLFKGQFKSTLKCHICSKVSVKFDEFCCLSVPIPKDQKLIQVVFFWKDASKRPKKFLIRLPADASVEDLKTQLSNRTGVRQTCMQVMETLKSKIQKIFARGASLSQITSSDVLMSFEVLDEQKYDEPILELPVSQRMLTPNPPQRCASCNRTPAPSKKLKRCTKCYRAGYCDTSCQKNHWPHHKGQCRLYPEPVGTPFIISLPESQATYSNLSRIVEGYARYSVDIFQPPVSQTQIVQRRRRRRRGSNSSGEISSEAEDMDVDSEGSGEAKDCEMEGGAYSGEDRAEADWPFYGGASGGSSTPGVGGGGLHGEQPSRVIRPRRSSSISSTSSGGEDIPQLSSSPGLRNAPAQKTLTPAPMLFSLRPITNRSQSLSTPAGDPLSDKGDEVLYLRDVQCLAMDWETNERRPVFCFVQNKEIDCEVEEEENGRRSKHTTLEACVDLFTQPENLSEGDSWRCPRCKKPVEATKQMSIWRLPTILIIQLKRFSFKYVLYSDKIDKFVQYPIKNFDLAPYMSTEPSDGTALYDLYGVINHMGRLLGGHYNAYCRTIDFEDTQNSEIDWRLCDDSRVSFVNESRIVHDQAYLLIYRRRGVSFTLPRPLLPPANEAPSPQKEEEEQKEEANLDANSEDSDSPFAGGVLQDSAEAMEGVTPMSISSISQFSSGSDPPSTVQEELD